MNKSSSTRCVLDATVSPKYYDKCFGVFLSRSTQKLATTKWFKEHFPAQLKQAGSESLHNSPFHVLGVGCGDGSGGDFSILDFVARHLMLIGSKEPVIFYQAIEPRSNSLEVFKDSAQKWKQENKDARVSFDWFLGTWQEFQVGAKQEPKKYNLVHFIQSFYHCGKIEETLRDCMENRLADDGFLFCLMMSEDHPIARYLKAFGFNYRTSEMVAAIAVKNGWKERQFFFDVQFDITEIFDEYSVEGNLLLDFITQTKDFRVVTEKTGVTQVMKHWLEDSVLCGNDTRLVHGKLGVVIIFKN